MKHIKKFNENVGFGEDETTPIIDFKSSLNERELEFIENFENLAELAEENDVDTYNIIKRYFEVSDYEIENHPKLGTKFYNNDQE